MSIDDRRYRVYRPHNSALSVLIIRRARRQDAGIYRCNLSGSSTRHKYMVLNVTGNLLRLLLPRVYGWTVAPIQVYFFWGGGWDFIWRQIDPSLWISGMLNNVFVSGLPGLVGLPVHPHYERVSVSRYHAFVRCFLFLRYFSANCPRIYSDYGDFWKFIFHEVV